MSHLIMMVNSTLETFVSGDGGDTDLTSGASPGLVVGLTLSFLLVATVAGVFVFKYRSKIRNTVQSGPRRSQRHSSSEATQADTQPYTDLIREPKTAHSPIYENLTTRTAGSGRLAENQSTSPEENFYLQCDSPDHAIYSNDPKCNPALLHDSPEEDVYIMPDS
ncbi:Hypothetical protein SMAX5B_005843 [Scophthalmus maximus]|uniref:Uncharacterized protein n=2 Tax=Scophthalmus maximus TaxID=52904 RepID=A0A2U9BJP9_SCOMX|nr:Hypothetical protein SMAX5B_005843 [Scophthalmus maximus]